MSETLSIMNGPCEAEDDFNLTVIRNGGSILLGRKVKGYGQGQLVLPGGKTRYHIGESGMSVRPFNQEAAREAAEETGLDLNSRDLVQKGILHIADYEDDTKTVRIYEAKIVSDPWSQLKSTELADLGWHPEDELRYEQMPQDYELWLPHILAGYAITAFFENESNELIEAKVFRQRLDPLGRIEEVLVQL